MVVERRQLAVPGVAQYLIETAVLCLASKERDTQRLRLPHVRRHLGQHRNTARDVETADADREMSGYKATRKIHGAGKLIGLHSYEANQGFAALLGDHSNDLVRTHAPVRFVVGVQTDLHVRPKRLAAVGVLRKPVQTGERVGRNGRPEPLNGIAVVIVVRRLDHDEVEQ